MIGAATSFRVVFFYLQIMATKTSELYVIDCGCEDCIYHHKNEVYTTKEEAEKELKKVKEIEGIVPNIVTLEYQLSQIKNWYY